jgi:predicted Fe-S protein YdhL (DUF1289 family)
MFFSLSPKPAPILTPCIGVCELDAAGICRGCWRSIDEIARWSLLGDAERARIMDVVLPARAAGQAPT